MLQTEAPSIPARRVSLATRTCRALIKMNGGAYMKEELKKLIEELDPEKLRLLYIVALELK